MPPRTALLPLARRLATMVTATALVAGAGAAPVHAAKPLTQDDRYRATEDTALVVEAPGLLANDRARGRVARLEVVQQPGHGTVRVRKDGSFVYRPQAGWSGRDSFRYRVTDHRGKRGASNVVVVVKAGDDPTVAVDDRASTSEDVAVAGNVLTNDTDPDDQLTVVAHDARDANGELELAADGGWSYWPRPDWSGTARIPYTTNTGATATLTIDVAPANDAPVAVADRRPTVEDAAVQMPASALLANDTDADGDTLTVTGVEGARNGRVALAGTTITFTPASNHAGPASFRYTVSDGRGGTASAEVSVPVVPVDDPSLVRDDTATTAEDTGASGNVLSNDRDVDDDLSVRRFRVDGTDHAAGDHASIPGQGGIAVGPDGTWDFTPARDWTGTFPAVTYTTSTGAGATLTITVSATNDPPSAVDDEMDAVEDTPVAIPTGDLLANDLDVDGDSFSLTEVGGAEHGTVGLVADEIVFTPAPDHHGTASFTYTLTDGQDTAEATVTLQVAPVNDAPVATDDTAETGEDAALVLDPADLLADDADVDGDSLTLTGVGDAQHGSVQLADGEITFTPTADYHGGAASFTYSVSDGHGGTDAATVTVGVTPINDPPDARDDVAPDVEEDTPLALDAAELLANDDDADGDTLSITEVGAAVGGSVELIGTAVFFLPAEDQHGEASFTYTVSDGQDDDTATVAIDVSPVNDAPVATDDTATTLEADPLDLPVSVLLAGDTDPDGDVLTVTAVGGATHGTVGLSGTEVTFIPATGFYGTASFTYTVSDGLGGTDTATVTVTVTQTGAVDDVLTTAEDETLTGNVLDNDDPGVTSVRNFLLGEFLTFPPDAMVVPGKGSLTIEADGDLTFIPALNWHGTFPVATYGVNTGEEATITIVVTPVDDPVEVRPDTATTPEDTPATGNVLTNDTDGSTGVTEFRLFGTTHAAGTTAEVDEGTLRIDSDGAWTFTPAQDWFTNLPFGTFPVATYTTDTGASTTLALTVTPVNDAPRTTTTFRDLHTDVGVAHILVYAVLNARDAEGDEFRITGIDPGSATGGTATLLPGGLYIEVTRAPGSVQTGFRYVVTDSLGASSTGAVFANWTRFAPGERGSAPQHPRGDPGDVVGGPLR